MKAPSALRRNIEPPKEEGLLRKVFYNKKPPDMIHKITLGGFYNSNN